MKRRICMSCKLAWAEHVKPVMCDACWLRWSWGDRTPAELEAGR